MPYKFPKEVTIDPATLRKQLSASVGLSVAEEEVPAAYTNRHDQLLAAAKVINKNKNPI